MTYDFFKLSEEKVEEILKKHDIRINSKDDDHFADFMTRIDSYSYSFNFAEKQQLYTYNSMLQTIAFSLADIKFEMHVEPWRRD